MIKLTSINKDLTSRTEKYGDTIYSEDLYNIGLVDEHYFIIDKTEVTTYCIEHYNEVKDIPNCNKIVSKNKDGSYHKKNTEFIHSYKLIKLLLANKDTLLKPICYDDNIMNTQFYDKVTEYKTLEYPNTCVKYQTYKPKETKTFYKVFFDFETETSKTHNPYLVRYETEDNETREFIGENCAIDMLNSLPDKPNIMLIAHNANYDCRFLLKYLSHEKPLVKGGRILSCNATFFRYCDIKQPVKIVIKDSLKIINMPLRKFGECFKLEVEKDIMPYAVYTPVNIDKVYVPITSALHYVKNNEKQQFLNNIDKWNCRGAGHKFNEYNIIKYSSEYCKLDCSVLHQGYDTFRNWMLEYTKLDIDDYITLQSLASDYKLKEGCYNDVAMFSGVVQHYISNCIVGGRCMTNSNKMYHVKRKLADFDACSLYPSAMRRILGYLKGTPKVLKQEHLNYNFLEKQSGYFIKIKVTHVGKFRQFPLLSKKTESGVRLFSNDIIGEIIYIDEITLEDAINFQSIKFEVIDGYYFNEGHNSKINKVISFLYRKRKELKKEKNPAQLVIKELMNSMYGKTILKPIETETVVKTIDQYDKYISFNYNFIQSSVKVGDRYYIKKIKSVIDHYNYAHCGVEILSMSKRIMNEVMTLAEDKKLNIWYQDTDSMHINYEDVEVLSKAFTEKYNRDLIGDDMSQFHIDFDLDGACGDIYSIESYFLAKKVYIDILESVDKDGNTIQGNHIRLKSVPTSCIQHTSNTLKQEPIDIYKHLYVKGNDQLFDLTENGGKCGFKFERDMSVRSYEANEFTRCITFPCDNERITVI